MRDPVEQAMKLPSSEERLKRDVTDLLKNSSFWYDTTEFVPLSKAVEICMLVNKHLCDHLDSFIDACIEESKLKPPKPITITKKGE